jgi:hypothetical protein
VDFRNQRHVGENIGIAHVIDGGLTWRFDNRAAGIAEIDRGAVDHLAGRMVGAHQRHP